MKPANLCRFSISMDGGLLEELDEMVRRKGYTNRSRAITEMVRDHVVEFQGERADHEIAGTITLVYDHHQRNIQSMLTRIQHDHGRLIISALHVHLDHDHCMEVLAVRGRAGDVRDIADRLIAAKGVKHGKLTVTTTGGKRHAAERHDHGRHCRRVSKG